MPLSIHSNQILITATRFLTGPSGPEQEIRESLVENHHLGWLVVTNRQKQLLYCTPGADEAATFFRSSAKPFQAFPMVQAGFHHELSTEELALACASHTGSQRHTDLAFSILKKAGYPESTLQCGPHNPTDPQALAQLQSTQQAPSRIHNNCSGKHAAMLLYCRKAGLDPATYLDPHHPLQQRIVQNIQQWGEVPSVPLAIDGCGAPVFYLPLHSMALLYAHLGTSKEFQPLQHAMSTFPEVVGGKGRVDTVIMQASQGKLLAKVGADGVLCVARVGSGEGLALKISDGAGDIRDMALVEILIRIGWLDSQAAQDEQLAPFRKKMIRTNTQDKPVGEFQLHFHP
jgi:L-asparaginase II